MEHVKRIVSAVGVLKTFSFLFGFPGLAGVVAWLSGFASGSLAIVVVVLAVVVMFVVLSWYATASKVNNTTNSLTNRSIGVSQGDGAVAEFTGGVEIEGFENGLEQGAKAAFKASSLKVKK